MDRAYLKAVLARKYEEDENWWQRRSGMERKLLALSILFFLIIAGCLTYIILKFTSRKEFCQNPKCLEVAAAIKARLAEDFDPCDDFFRFVCDTAEGDAKELFKQQLEEELEKNLNEVVREPVEDDDHHVVKKQKEFYQFCLNETGTEDFMNFFQEFLDEIQGWPVVVGYRWRARLFEWMDVVYVLRDKGYPFAMMLAPGVFTDAEDAAFNFYIAPPSDLEPFANNRKYLYKNLMVEAAVRFGAERHQAEIQMADVLDFINKLAELKSEKNDSIEATKLTVEEAQENYPQLNWKEFVNNLVQPSAWVSENSTLVFSSIDFLEGFFELIAHTPRRVQANYMVWKVVEEMMPFMSKDLQFLQKNYSCQVNEPFGDDRALFCADLTRKSFFLKPSDVLYARRFLEKSTQDEAAHIFDAVKSEFGRLLGEMVWIDEEDARKGVAALGELERILGAPEDYLNDTIFEDFPEIPESENASSNFFQVLLAQKKQYNDALFGLISDALNETKLFEIITSDRVVYSKAHNVLGLPTIYLQKGLYDPDYPTYVNYATLGVLLGRKLVGAFYENVDNFWSEVIAKSLQEQTQCLVEDEQENSSRTEENVLSVEDLLGYHSGLKIAYNSYQKWREESGGSEEQILGVDYTPNQIFWITAMSLQCFALSAEERDSNSTQRARQVSVPFRNNAFFADDFGCAPESPMNPPTKCEVF